MSTTNIDERERELWDRDGELAIQCAEWFETFGRLVRLTHRGMPAEKLAGIMRGIDADKLDEQRVWLMRLLREGFAARGDDIQIARKRSHAGKRERRGGVLPLRSALLGEFEQLRAERGGDEPAAYRELFARYPKATEQAIRAKLDRAREERETT